MKKTILFGALCIVLSTAAGCGKEESSIAVNTDDIVIHIPKEKSQNLERFESFAKYVKDKQHDEIHIKNYLTDEQAKVPSVETVTYQDETFTFSSIYKGESRTDTCKKFVTPKETHNQAYMLRECSKSEEGIVLQYTAKDGEGSHSVKNKRVESVEVEADKKYSVVKDMEVGAILNVIKFPHQEMVLQTVITPKPNYKININYLSGEIESNYIWINKETSQGIMLESEQANQGYEIDKMFIDDFVKVLK
ncbi:hypothetical protein [Bacillus cereus]|uniref:hypothetical protein n=1 Tax=Bacillus cereus TaxID=1396 RepID=UPI00027A9CC8|nr:hypothetical protein [Bacillus cereus]EJS63148.1 hypothetical protein ICU_04754 [Bacillus cereus BAG2X1-1]EJS68573.1 hypothetical protein ICY_04647 [Bacillus cereus BAG2X1-3]